MSRQNEGLKNPSNTKGINTNPWFLHLLQIHDSAFPTGTFAHSFGMETYIQEHDIKTPDDLLVFCEMYLRHNLASTDAIIAVEAFRLAQAKDIEGLIHLEKLCHGIKLSSESRKGSAMLGRQFMRMVFSLTDDELVALWHDKIKSNEVKGHYPIVYGIYTAMLGVEVDIALETFLYSSVVALVQNAVRAVPLGQKGGIETVFALLPVIQEVAQSVMTKELDDLDNNTVGLEIASMKHEFLYLRLFMS